MNIHILRLQNGTDIICDMELDDGVYYINHPMEIWMEQVNKTPKLCMDHWLPVQVIEDNCATIKKEDVLTTLVPNSQLMEYYVNTIDEMNSVLRAKKESENMTDEEIIDTIIALQEGSGATFH